MVINTLKALALLVIVGLSSTLKADEIFAGCAPSAGECRNSCSDHIGRAEADALQCLLELDTWGCFCGAPIEIPPITVPEGFAFIGCRPSPGECLNSCPTQSGIVQNSPEMCSADYEREPFACFCDS